MKFLLIRFSSIGDIVLTTPVIRCLKRQLPEAEIHFLTRKPFAAVLAANPYIDKLHVQEGNLSELVRLLKEEAFDQIIDLHNNIRTARIKWALGKPSFSFPKLNIEKWLLVQFKWNRMPEVHIVDRYLETVQSFGIRNDGKGLDYFIPADAEVDLRTLPFPDYIGLVIGAAHATKRMPLHKLKELILRLPGPIVVLGGKEDGETGNALAAVDPVRIYNACGKYTINQSASLVQQARLIITHDTGLMHIASAFQKPIVSIWGNTVPAFGMYPYLTAPHAAAYQAEVKGLSCRPCSKIGYKACPKGHFNCMEQQNLAAITEAAASLGTKKP